MSDMVDGKAAVVQDKYYMGDTEDTEGMLDRVDKVHMVEEKAEEMVFCILVADRVLDEWARVQNYNYHNILHSILVYIYYY